MNIEKEENKINKELKYMAEYISEIWTLDKVRVELYLKELYQNLEKDYKYQIDEFDITRSILPLINKREEKLSNDIFSIVDSLALFGRSVMKASFLSLDKNLNFENKNKEYFSKSTDKECFKNPKLKGWAKNLDYELLINSDEEFVFSKFKGTYINSPSAPSFEEALLPINIAYINERHSYGVKNLLEQECLSHLMQFIKAKNIVELKEDVENVFIMAEAKYSNKLSQPLFIMNLEDDLKSNVGVKIANIIKKSGYNKFNNEVDFNKKVEELSHIEPITPETEQKLVKENTERLLKKLSR